MHLTLDRLGKCYGERWALREVSSSWGGGIVGLVGPNGAGKTTLLRIIATLLPATEGSVTWDGRDTRHSPADLRASLGYLPQAFGLPPELSARQFLCYMADMKGLPRRFGLLRAAELLDTVGLNRDADRRLAEFSGGMKQRVGIAQALLNDPRLLVVDEPTAGLDPEERVRFRTLLGALAPDRLVILSTHIIGDVEAIADRLVLLKEGRVLADTTPTDLLGQAAGKVWSVITDVAGARELQQRYLSSALSQSSQGTSLRLLSRIPPADHAVSVEPTLEEAYLLSMNP